MGSRRVSRGCRAVITVLLGGACLSVVMATRAGVTFPAAGGVASAATRGAAGRAAEVSPAPPPVVVADRPDQWFRPSGRNQGTEGLVDALARLALQDNAPLYVSETWGRTTGGTNSDHHASRTDSWALDVAVRGVEHPTAATEMAAKRIATALGEPGWTGGDLRTTIGGYRIQLLWKVAGHFNHVHVGVRKVT